MTTYYRYLFVDLVTNDILGELPLTGVTFTQQLNQAGTLQGHLLLSGMTTAQFNVNQSTTPARTGIYVDRNGSLIWGGVIWNRRYNSTMQRLEITAREFESYFERRRINADTVFNNTDQLVVARTLINNAQSQPYGNIGVQVGTETSGVLISRTYYNYELKQVYQAIQDLSRADDGFDFNIKVAYDPITKQPTKTLVLGYPRIGTPYSPTNPNALVFIFPAGNIVEYEYPEDGSQAANTMYGSGAGSNEGKLTTKQQNTPFLLAGWPLLEDVANYSDITDLTLLQKIALAQAQAVSYPPTTIKVVVPAYVIPTLNDYAIGDSARLIITDERFPNTLDSVYRIVALSVQPGEDGPERVTITFTTTTN